MLLCVVGLDVSVAPTSFIYFQTVAEVVSSRDVLPALPGDGSHTVCDV